ncbi:group II intron reverse transcriptase/maturase, partial [Pseudomonas aeruginosa]|nr:group II intron reverse transcriptase/maturase [Pseudomonas aeruginosa]
FLPGASADALKRMRQAVRRWRLNRQTHVTLVDVARLYNPVIQGWWQYYGSFYRTAMLGIFQHIDRALERWARRKYKALHRRKRRISQWLDKMRTVVPRLFHNWRVTGQQG